MAASGGLRVSAAALLAARNQLYQADPGWIRVGTLPSLAVKNWPALDANRV